MTKAELIKQIFQKQSFLCVGLDPDLEKIPDHIKDKEHPIFAFNKAIIDATREYCVAYKPNHAFYECLGDAGWRALKKTIEYIGDSHFVIADAKRGDIGNTSKKYAESIFNYLNADAVTIHPYMGKDSVQEFLEYKEKWVVLLAATSNKSAENFQFLKLQNAGTELYHEVIKQGARWADSNQLMFVTGATRPEILAEIRKLIPDYFLLVPGIGAQGGSLEAVSRAALTDDCGILVNVSRGILYNSKSKDFAEAAGAEAQRIQLEMAVQLEMLVLKSKANR